MAEEERDEGAQIGTLDDSQREHRQELQQETISENKTCPECGEPVDNVRATCPSCGKEYGDKEYDDEDAGEEFMAGSLLNEDGTENTDPEALEDVGDDEGSSEEEEAEEVATG